MPRIELLANDLERTFCAVIGASLALMVNRGAYRIADDTGQLWVVSDRGTPRKGARVTVKGTIREGFNLGSLGDQINRRGLAGDWC